ncbi:ABC transporter ATP-binding protein [Yinghuangia aomiensis]
MGFNSQLTGRENVVLGGLAQGKAEAEVEEKYEEIAAFADIGEFMDMPMKSYSSGMYQRLAFAVGVHMDPDILLVDEAGLSAGDAAFKRKAARKMDELCRAARTIILVSHGMASVREMANHCLWLHKAAHGPRRPRDDHRRVHAVPRSRRRRVRHGRRLRPP